MALNVKIAKQFLNAKIAINHLHISKPQKKIILNAVYVIKKQKS